MIGDKKVSAITIDDFDVIKMRMSQDGLSRARIASVIFSMKAFLNYCRDELGEKTIDTGEVKAPPQEKNKVVRTMHPQEIRRVIDDIELYYYAGKKREKRVNINALRWQCLLECLWSSGMRISEALSLNRCDIDFYEGEAVICGKGNKERKVFFSEKAVKMMKFYLSYRCDSHKALFVTHHTVRRWNLSSAQRYMEQWRKKTNIQQHITFHTLRRSFATYMCQKTDIYTASKLLGHADLSTTKKHYIREDWENLRESHHEVFAE